jgi:uncharacterized protein YrrD
MLHRIKELREKKLLAMDGPIGHVKDVYFDDRSWAVRYLVANPGSWLAERRVLISPHALGPVSDDALQVNLTRHQIEHCPPIEAHEPVSRRYEAAYYKYYGWPNYWDEGGMLGGAIGFPSMATPPLPPPEDSPADSDRDHVDPHLQSAHTLAGYTIEASDARLGHVGDFVLSVPGWNVRQVIAATGHWFSSKELLLPTDKIERIDCKDAKVFVRLTQAGILATSSASAPVPPSESR